MNLFNIGIFFGFCTGYPSKHIKQWANKIRHEWRIFDWYLFFARLIGIGGNLAGCLLHPAHMLALAFGQPF